MRDNVGIKNWVRLKYAFRRTVIPKDRAVFQALKPFISKGATALDIGCYIGGWSKMLLEHVGANGKVIAFEPNPLTYQICNSFIRSINYELFNIALSDRVDRVKFVVPKKDCLSSGSAILQTADQLAMFDLSSSLVDCSSLDSMEIDLNNLQFIKCDVEGHELNVFKGAKSKIEKHRPIILCEILREKWIDQKPIQSEIVQYLLSLRYIPTQYNNGNFVSEKYFIYENEDFIFFPQEKLFTTIL